MLTHKFLAHMLVEISGCKHLFFCWDISRFHFIVCIPVLSSGSQGDQGHQVARLRGTIPWAFVKGGETQHLGDYTSPGRGHWQSLLCSCLSSEFGSRSTSSEKPPGVVQCSGIE